MKLFFIFCLALFISQLDASSPKNLQGCNPVISNLTKSDFFNTALKSLKAMPAEEKIRYKSDKYLEYKIGPSSHLASEYKRLKGSEVSDRDIENSIKKSNYSTPEIDSRFEFVKEHYSDLCAKNISELALMKLYTDFNCDNDKCEIKNVKNS
jgi:hypothetical protein